MGVQRRAALASKARRQPLRPARRRISGLHRHRLALRRPLLAPLGLDPASASLVVFNLGYLPGGDKEVYTRADTTVEALRAAERAVVAGGCVSATLYPGHAEGEREEEAVLRHAANLPFGQWSVHYTQWLNQRNKKDGSRAPSLCLMQRLNAGRSDGRRPQRAAPGAPLHAPWQG